MSEVIKTKLQTAIERLKAECHTGDIEADHGKADDILLWLIGNEEVSKAFEDVERWYA